MGNVFKSEAYRLHRSKEVWGMVALLTIFSVLGVIMDLVMKFVPLFQESSELMAPPEGFFEGFTGAAGGMGFKFLIPIMICSLIVKLYTSGVNKQLVSCGVSRGRVILGQFVAYTAAFTAVALITAVVNGVCHLISGGGLGLDVLGGRFALSMVGMVLQVACYVAVFLLVVHLTASMGAAIVLGFALQFIVPMGFFSLGNFIGEKAAETLSDLYFANQLSRVVDESIKLGEQLQSMGIILVYIVVFLLLCQAVFKNKEVK